MSSDRVREVRIAETDLPAPGRVAIVTIGHHRIGVMRVGEHIHALADRCPHRGAPLCSSGVIVTDVERRPDGTLELGQEDSLIRCPWHKWDFDISTGTCPADARMRVRRYAVRRDGDDVIVSLDRVA
jgi:nitrite reductase/ring-hydroxylating ferredoxin subunit